MARQRMTEVGMSLRGLDPLGSITAGLAQLSDDDTLEGLILRADAALYRAKAERSRGSSWGAARGPDR